MTPPEADPTGPRRRPVSRVLVVLLAATLAGNTTAAFLSLAGWTAWQRGVLGGVITVVIVGLLWRWAFQPPK